MNQSNPKKKKKQIKLTRTVQLNHLGPKANHHKIIPLIIFFSQIRLDQTQTRMVRPNKSRIWIGHSLGSVGIGVGSWNPLRRVWDPNSTQEPTQCSFFMTWNRDIPIHMYMGPRRAPLTKNRPTHWGMRNRYLGSFSQEFVTSPPAWWASTSPKKQAHSYNCPMHLRSFKGKHNRTDTEWMVPIRQVNL